MDPYAEHNNIKPLIDIKGCYRLIIGDWCVIYEEYEMLLDRLEDQIDVEEVQEFRKDNGEKIPFELLKLIASKKKNAVSAFGPVKI